MTRRDVDSALRAAAELRRLCLALPHLATPAETARLARFDELARAPERATPADVEALVTGWRAWWRAGSTAAIAAMAERVDRAVIDSDRTLATYAVAAGAACAEAAMRGDTP